jgi:hypothetical protein
MSLYQQPAFEAFQKGLQSLGIHLACGPETIYFRFKPKNEMLPRQPFWNLCQAIFQAENITQDDNRKEIDSQEIQRLKSVFMAAIIFAGKKTKYLTFSGMQGTCAFLLEIPNQSFLVRVGQKGDGRVKGLPICWTKIPELFQPIKSREFPVKLVVDNFTAIDCIHIVPRVIPMDQAIKAGLYTCKDFEAWVEEADVRIRKKYNLTFNDYKSSSIEDFDLWRSQYKTSNFGLMILPNGEKHVGLLDPGCLKIADPSKPFTQESDPKLFGFQRRYVAALKKGELAQIIQPVQADMPRL